MNRQNLNNLINPVKLLLLDVDGVLTSGTIIYNDNGSETKIFNVKDGLGIRLLMDAGIRVGIITGRSSGALEARCKNLGIDQSMIFQGTGEKTIALDTILEKTGLSDHEIAFAGDDLPDIRVMKRAGFPVAVANACQETMAAAAYTTSAEGGNGAVREICELILKSKDLWNSVTDKYL